MGLFTCSTAVKSFILHASSTGCIHTPTMYATSFFLLMFQTDINTCKLKGSIGGSVLFTGIFKHKGAIVSVLCS